MVNQDFTYGSVCSGVEAATVAWHGLGWSPAWFCEFDKFPSAVLDVHYPDVPNLHDMEKILENEVFNDRSIDLLVGGTPCQSFSIAGLRKGLDDERGNLSLKFCEILQRKQPRWFVWENVPGVLSSDEGRDFGNILGAMGECGYGVSYRVLDAQYFGVAQRRRRVFVVGYLGDWRPAAAVLFERESLQRHPAPSREKKQNLTGTITASIGRTRGAGIAPETIVSGGYTSGSFGGYTEGCGTLRAEGGDLGGGSETLIAQEVANCLQTTCDDYSRADGFNMVVHGTQDLCILDEIAHTLGRNNGQENAVCFQQNADGDLRENDVFGTLNTNSSPSARNVAMVRQNMEVRRLTPIECERLQGFPDDYTNIPWRNKNDAPDGPRYKAMGNSMAVPVMRWIGERIQKVNNLKEDNQ